MWQKDNICMMSHDVLKSRLLQRRQKACVRGKELHYLTLLKNIHGICKTTQKPCYIKPIFFFSYKDIKQAKIILHTLLTTVTNYFRQKSFGYCNKLKTKNNNSFVLNQRMNSNSIFYLTNPLVALPFLN